VNPLTTLRTHQFDAEYDAAVWIDDHDRLRRVAAFLAHHLLAQFALLILASPILAAVGTVWAVGTAARVIARAHEVAGEDTVPCTDCVNREALSFSRTGELTYADVCNAWDLADGGL
jgi:hypothetical protein